ncbi:hypothetical protein ACFQZZ_24035 [Nocardia sp. GCM10030253]|uniref:hypothetical protein n=1 Tax=Nocardia sp. GCM10030253 TaxID=3273404 RepID=UPI00363B880F
MTSDERRDSSRDKGLVDWLDRVSGRISFVRDAYVNEVELDYSARSIDDLEEFLLCHFDTPAELVDDPWIVDGVIGYLGEMLARLAGGGWTAADPDRVYRRLPLIEAAEELHLRPLSPSDLVLAAVRRRTGEEFGAAYAAWEQAVAAYRITHPSWTPIKRPTPGIEPVDPQESDIVYLREWLTAREHAFPAWVAAYGADAGWDYSVDSLDTLGVLVMRYTPTVAEIEDPANAVFLDGAAWYIGETWRRVKGGRWCYRHGDPEVAVYVGYPYVESPDPDGKKGVPFRAMRRLVKQGNPRQLREQYEMFVQW